MTVIETTGVREHSPPPKNTRPLRALMLRLHFYAGIFVGPFLLIAALTGFVYAFAPTLESWVYGSYLRAPVVEQPVAESAQVQAALDGRDASALQSVQTADPGGTTRVLFDDPDVGSGQSSVFVDPGTGTVLGALETDSGDLPLRAWLSALHKNLHLGDVGNLYSELAASWLFVIVLGGLYLWWNKARADRPRGKKARLLTVDRSLTGRRLTLNWHGAVGAWAALGLLFLSATGLSWSDYAGANIKTVRAEMSWNAPALNTSLGGAPAAGGGEHDGHGAAPTADGGPAGDAASGADPVDVTAIDGVLHVARAQGLTGQLSVGIPADVSTAWTVKETAKAGGDSIAVDGYTLRVVDRVDFADGPLAAKLTSWGIALHMGTLFGLANQVALAALAVALITVIARGYLMWWRRRPTRASGAAFGAAPRRGALRRQRLPVVAVVAVVALAVGLFVPLLGLSLAAFLVVDVFLGLVASARSKKSTQSKTLATKEIQS
ncbi:PepSY-associated TM helix domain-containing protein [Rhodococcus kronopolitis]|uniref:PepSY-associated TM helix domain-containing protein n=1 Tax=Rhodococcus kronopolitis TaxID=1460226 RepID=A0ABV9FR02_9NOCA